MKRNDVGWKSISLVALLAGAVAACSLWPETRPVTDVVNLRDGLSLNEGEGWIILARPNSIWTVGTVVEKRPDSDARDLGAIASLGCFPENAWRVAQGTGPSVQYGRAIDYSVAASAALGLPAVEFAKAGISLGGDGKAPTHRFLVVLNKVTEYRVDLLKAEEFVQGNFQSMSEACQQNLLNANRFVVDKILVIEDAELSFADNAGAKVDLSLPQYEFIKDAALNIGYSLVKDGVLKVPQGQPVTLAIRQGDFSSATRLLQYGTASPDSSSNALSLWAPRRLRPICASATSRCSTPSAFSRISSERLKYVSAFGYSP